MNDQTRISTKGNEPRPGPFLARVISHLDSTFMGMLQVELLRPTGNTGDSGQLHQVKYMSPFYGVTSADFVREDPDNYGNTQKSYGMWAVPPDVGTTVVVIFIDGDPKRGYWIGCVPDEGMNFMVPGIAGTEKNVEGTYTRAPVAEYNKKINGDNPDDSTKFTKPTHPLADVLNTQGLINDDIRGLTTSSARREVPSMVFGWSTPGPVDKQSGAPRGGIGKSDSRIPNAFVSRLGGSTFVMDDGDDKFLRKTKASDGPPEYASVLAGETGGDPTIPHNELVRIRTRTGHQILLHNSEDLIYIGNARGTTWIELTSNGKIDIYAADDISMHTAGNFNVTADKDINLTSTGGDVNIKSSGKTNINPDGDLNLKSGGNANINAGGNTNILAANTAIDGGNINLNSGVATGAAEAVVAPRVPDAEPWADHENLHGSPLAFTTATDTFSRVQGAEEEQQ
jgi:Type VI secretion system/phage-baseplate injector OB domain